MSETTPLIKAALNLRVGVGFDVYFYIGMVGVKYGFVGLRAEYRQDGKSTLEACLHKCFGQIGCILRQQNMSMKRSGMRMGSASSP